MDKMLSLMSPLLNIVMNMNPAVTGAIGFLVLTMLVYALKICGYIRREGAYDLELANRVVELIDQCRIKDAAALCDIEPGIFPRIYRAAMEAPEGSRQNSAYNIMISKEECLKELRAGLGVFAALCVLLPVVGFGGSLYNLLHRLDSFSTGDLPLIAGALLEASRTTVAGILAALPSAGLFVYCILKIRSVSNKINAAGLRVLSVLYDRHSTPAYKTKPVPTSSAPAAAPVAVRPSVAAATPAPAKTEERAPAPRFPVVQPAPAAKKSPAATEASVWDALPRL